MNLDKNQYSDIKRVETSRESWETLRGIFESKEPMRQCVLYKQLYRLKKNSQQSMTQYIDKFIHKIEQFEESGIKLPDTVLPIMLLSSLPVEYDTLHSY